MRAMLRPLAALLMLLPVAALGAESAPVRSDRAEVQWIFVAEHLKKLLLDRADAADAPADLQAAARRALRQPGAKSHWDHFHVRIRCPGGPGGVCRDARAARADGG